MRGQGAAGAHLTRPCCGFASVRLLHRVATSLEYSAELETLDHLLPRPHPSLIGRLHIPASSKVPPPPSTARTRALVPRLRLLLASLCPTRSLSSDRDSTNGYRKFAEACRSRQSPISIGTV